MQEQKGFTLIELLVVIAIIALLMSILMPAVERAKKQAKYVICQSNLHQWSIVWELFLGDHKGRFMSGDEWGELMDGRSGAAYEYGVDDHDHSWAFILTPYYSNYKLLCCPEASKPPQLSGKDPGHRTRGGSVFSTWLLWIHYDDEFMYGSYGINSWCYDRGTKIDGELVIDRWRRPPTRGAHEVPIMLDCYWCEGYPHHTDNPPQFRYTGGGYGDSGNYMKRFTVDRHNGFTNGLFCDLSVRKVGLKELWELKWHPGWNEDNNPPPVWPDWMKDLSEPY
jgi:prepilin-type N-terminal cleavage/methylation domain-containing protein/prepilin-type processing-associated H-X9-DG protein